MPRRGATSGMVQFVLLARDHATWPGAGHPAVRARCSKTLKQLGNYTDAELKAAINDAYLFATEQPAVEVDDEGNPIVTRAGRRRRMLRAS